MKLTKIDVAEAHLISAVRLHFQCGHPASVYLLAASAREILTTIGDKTGVRTVLHGVAENTGTPLKDLIASAGEHVNFLKHANRDPSAVLESLTEQDVDVLLFVACTDFGRIAGGQAVELQTYEVWYLAQYFQKVADAPLRFQSTLKGCRRHFPGINSIDRKARQSLGWTRLQKDLKNPDLIMEIRREVALPSKPTSQKSKSADD